LRGAGYKGAPSGSTTTLPSASAPGANQRAGGGGSPALIKIHPEWRGHMYFVVGDQIIVVDRNHRIIAIINV
jgi:hypothetical protein